MNYYTLMMTITNNYVLITILLTHGTSSKKVNEHKTRSPIFTFEPQYKCPWILLHSYPSTRTYSRSIMSCRHVEIIIHIGWSDADSEIPATG